jgi:hypothetical protein
MERVRAFGCFALVLGAADERVSHPDPFDHQDLVLQVDLALGFRRELSLAGVDPARLQRATQRARESTGGRGDHVIEGGGVVGVLAWRGAVVLADLVMGAEEHRFRFDREEGAADGPSVADDPHARDVFRLVFTHVTRLDEPYRSRLDPGYGVLAYRSLAQLRSNAASAALMAFPLWMFTS